ncbi:MAG: GNAT superfamily N-acetyltransferase [Verrucomicrobiales bacterium]|jgi:GNAT superfamily N-acetyltransferase
MESRHEKMTMESFERMPHRLGWKYEYGDGLAHITPGHHSVMTFLDLSDETPRQRVIENVRVTEIDAATDHQPMLDLYVLAFLETYEFCDSLFEDIIETASKDIAGFLNETRGPINRASRVAIDTTSGALIGATLIADTQPNLTLDPEDVPGPEQRLLLVDQAWQRQGLGQALLGAACAALRAHGKGCLRSRYAVGNEPSQHWHHQAGFVDRPGPLALSHYLMHARWELARLKNAGELDDAEICQREEAFDELSKERERLMTLSCQAKESYNGKS